MTKNEIAKLIHKLREPEKTWLDMILDEFSLKELEQLQELMGW